MRTDFEATNHGSITVLTPKTRDARQWCEDHLPDDCPTWAKGYAIESNYFPPVADGIAADGLTIA